MPYSDNLYSMVDDDSDVEPNDHPMIQAQFGQYSQPQDSFQNIGQNQYGGEASRSSATFQIDGDEDLYDVESDVLSPTDGYFRAAPETSTSPSASARESSPYSPHQPTTASITQAPHVPNVWVEDPTLQPGSTAESKAREADEERRANPHLVNNPNTYASDYTYHTAPAPRSSYSHTTYTPTSPQHSSGSGSGSGSHYSNQAAYTYHHRSSSSAYNPSSTLSYTSYVPRQAPYNEGSQFFTPSEAPPAYTPSPTSPSNSSAPSGRDLPRNYNTFPGTNNTPDTMGGREETEGLLARDPESMASPDDGLGGETPVWRERLRRRLPYLNWRSGKVLVAALVLLLLTVGFLTSIVSGIRNEKGDNDQVNKPINSPPGNKEPVNQPDDPPMPSPGQPDLDNGFQWRSGFRCQSDKIARPTEQFSVSFAADQSLSILQTISTDNLSREGRHVQVQGDVIFRRGESGDPSSSIVLEIVVSDDRINVATGWDANGQVLSVAVPNSIPWNQTPEGPCVSVVATVWVPENGALNGLGVKTTQLSISLYDNLWLEVAKDTRLSSTVGTIVSASTGMSSRDDQIFDLGAPDSFRFSSRVIDVETTSAPIQGSWPLLDYLGLISTSGNIKACVEPKEVDKDVPSPATLYVKSFSGDVTIREPIHAAKDAFNVGQTWKLARPESKLDLRAETVLPPRDYRVNVHTTSGTISGAFAFSSSAGFKSTSGNMKIELLPVLDSLYAEDNGRSALLSTASTSGNHGVGVLEPMWVDSSQGSYIPFPVAIAPIPELPAGDVPPVEEKTGAGVAAAAATLRSLNSQHSLTSGDMKLHYPSAWEGELSLATNSGRLTVVGQGVEIIKSGKGFPGYNKYILARKGEEGGGRFLAKTTSGDILVTVGN